MRQVLTLARKEFRDVLRERSLVTMILIQFFIAGFSAFLMVGLSSLYDPSSAQGLPSARVAYVGSGGFAEYLDDADNLDVLRVSEAQADQMFRDGEVTAWVEEFTEGPTSARFITLVLPAGDIQSSLLVNQFKSLFLEYEKDVRFDRQDRLEHQVVYADNEAQPPADAIFGYTVLLPLLVLTPVFLSGAIASDAFNQELEGHTLLLLRSTPMSTFRLLLGKLLVPILLVPAQTVLWILLLLGNGFPVDNMGPIVLFTSAAAIGVCSLGIVTAFHVRQAGQSQAAFALVSIALALLSMLLPRDPLNLIARLGVGIIDLEAWLTIGIITAFSAVMALLAFWDVDRNLRESVD